MATSEKLDALLHSLFSSWMNAADSGFCMWMLPPDLDSSLTNYAAIADKFKDDELVKTYKDAKEVGDLMLALMQLGFLGAAMRSFMLRILNPARAYITSSVLYEGNSATLNILRAHISALAANINAAKEAVETEKKKEAAE